MKICVFGLWHLGSVTAACLAEAGHEVSGLDPDPRIVTDLRMGTPPVAEPGLAELVRQGLDQGRLRFHTDARQAVQGCAVLWVTFDTPVDDDDNPDTDFVVNQITGVLPLLDRGTVVLVSSQLPVGTCREVERDWNRKGIDRQLRFACSPENLRLGKALEVFRSPDRVVMGVRTNEDRNVLKEIFRPITDRLLWMSVEAAEMTKHALNAYLALSITFANEIAALCERVGADAKDVERGLKSEARIGPGAYLSPGAAFAGGTLARDVAFLTRIAAQESVQSPLLAAVRASNDHHRGWPQRKLAEILGDVAGKTVGIWGLTYKPGTDTLRRSSSVELCRWLLAKGATVQAYDPAVTNLPGELSGVRLFGRAEDAARDSDALVVMTGWPQFREISLQAIISTMKSPSVVDPGRVLQSPDGKFAGIRYFAVGTASLAGAG